MSYYIETPEHELRASARAVMNEVNASGYPSHRGPDVYRIELRRLEVKEEAIEKASRTKLTQPQQLQAA